MIDMQDIHPLQSLVMMSHVSKGIRKLPVLHLRMVPSVITVVNQAVCLWSVTALVCHL